MEVKTEHRPLLTAQQIIEEIHDMARMGEGADRRWALKTIQAESQQEAGLAPPFNSAEIIERLIRVMRPAGKDICKIAFSRAFRMPEGRIKAIEPNLAEAQHLDPYAQDRIRRSRTLKYLYKLYPSIKRPGFPPGYPVGKGPEIKSEWCRRQATLIEVSRVQKELNESAQSQDTPEPQAQ